MHRLVLAVLLAWILACTPDSVDHASTEHDAARIEGRTAAVADGASLYALRLWSAPELDSLDRLGLRVDSLDVVPAELRLRRGQRLPLSTLNVVALDAAGRAIPGAPIVLEVDTVAVVLTPENVVARAPGRSLLRIRSLLPGRNGVSSERIIAVIVDG